MKISLHIFCVRISGMNYFQGQSGMVLVKTTTLMLVATYADHMYPSVCVEAVEKLGEYIY